jgi:hypothetical protein
MRRQDDFDEFCRRLLAEQPVRKPDYDLVWSLVCYGMAVVVATCLIVWGSPAWPF